MTVKKLRKAIELYSEDTTVWIQKPCGISKLDEVETRRLTITNDYGYQHAVEDDTGVEAIVLMD